MNALEKVILTGLGLFVLQGAALVGINASPNPDVQKFAHKNSAKMTEMLVGTGIITSSLANIRNRRKDAKNALEI